MSSFVSNKFKSNGYWERIINFAFVNSTFFNFSNWVPFDGENLKEKQAEKDLNSLKILVVGLKRWKEKDRGQCSKPDTLLTKPQKMVKFHTIPDFHLSFFTSRPLSLFSNREYETKQMWHVLLFSYMLCFLLSATGVKSSSNTRLETPLKVLSGWFCVTFC